MPYELFEGRGFYNLGIRKHSTLKPTLLTFEHTPFIKLNALVPTRQHDNTRKVRS